MSRVIFHLDMDAFFASVEQQANPALRGKPVLVGARPSLHRTVVAAASYEARPYGIKSGMSAHEALQRCPHAVFVPADTAKYVSTSDQIFELLQQYTPQVEPVSIDEFFLDMGSGRLQGAVTLAQRIKEEIRHAFGLPCTIGIAENKRLAKLAAKLHKPDGLGIIQANEVRQLLDPLPVERLCGIGERLKAHLLTLGIATCGVLARYPVDRLIRRFGILGYQLHAMARGLDDSLVRFAGETAPPRSIGHSQTLPQNTRDLQVLGAWLRLLSERVARRLRQGSWQGHVVTLTLRDARFRTRSHQRRFSTPSDDGLVIYQRAWLLFGGASPTPPPTRLVGVSVSELVPAGQMGLFPEDERRSRVLAVLDTINGTFGEFTLRHASTYLIGVRHRIQVNETEVTNPVFGA